jgi:hypothetical protein
MTEAANTTGNAADIPTLDDVLEPTEQAIPDHRAHGKIGHRVNDDELERRTEQERVEVGVDDYDPDSVPPAED